MPPRPAIALLARAFVDRDWDLPGRIQLEDNVALVRRGAHREILRRADELLAAGKLLTPGWPDDTTQQEDLEAHVELARKLRAAGQGA